MHKKTRNQLKRERIQTACMAVALLFLWTVLCTMMVKAWAGHPAEQSVSYAEHMEVVQIIGGDSDVLS